jgi:hypothetical protein
LSWPTFKASSCPDWGINGMTDCHSIIYFAVTDTWHLFQPKFNT